MKQDIYKAWVWVRREKKATKMSSFSSDLCLNKYFLQIFIFGFFYTTLLHLTFQFIRKSCDNSYVNSIHELSGMIQQNDYKYI